MAEELADTPYLLAEIGLHDKDRTRSVRSYAKDLFAEIAVRIIAFGADLIVVLFGMIFLNERLFGLVGLGDDLRTAAWMLLMIAYFTVSWTSPLRATPLQWLLGLRVLHQSGRQLKFHEALIRGVAVSLLWAFVLFALHQFFRPVAWFLIAAVALLLYVPSITARRQGPHDYLVRSVVVNRRALRSADDQQRMQKFLADEKAAVSKAARPSIPKMITDALVLGVPLYLMVAGIQFTHHKNMYARISYAMHAAQETKYAAQKFYLESGAWPQTETELGMPMRHNYPAGGYFELQGNGSIRVQFEILPELKNGTILIEPQVDAGKVAWQCRAIGDIRRKYLPAGCREH